MGPGLGTAALEAGYSNLVKKKRLPSINCQREVPEEKGGAAVCEIIAEIKAGRKKSTIVKAEALHKWLQVDSEWVKYVGSLCATNLRIARDRNASSSWKSVQGVMGRWSQQLVSAVVAEQELYQRCYKEL